MSGADSSRHSRQIRYDGIGAEGQARIAAGSVTIVGCGALGSTAAEILVRAGVGRIRIVDRDVVEPSNLQRQSLFTEEDARKGLPKAEAAADRLRAIDGSTVVEPFVRELGPGNALELLGGSGLVLDGSDNFAARYVMNDAAFRLGIPFVHGAALGGSGTVAVFVPPGPCYRCLVERPPAAGLVPTCETAGIVAPLPYLVASLEANEALKLLSGRGGRLEGLLGVDIWHRVELRRFLSRIPRRERCECCGTGRMPALEAGADGAAATLCGRDAVQITPPAGVRSDLDRIEANLKRVGEVRRAGSALRAEVEGIALTLFADGRCLLRGIDDPERARSIYARFVGE
jgi:adenylyltransferase/sulfurtransferase